MKKIPLPISMLAVTFCLVWVGMCPVFNPWLVDGMLFHPDREIDSSKLSIIEGIHGREIEYGKGLTGWYYEVPNSKYLVLFSHGNAGNMSHRVQKIRRLIQAGQSVFIWDYAGFGNSKGLESLKTISKDAESTYDAALNLEYKSEQIVLYGESVGAGVNAEIASSKKVAGIIIDSGFTSLNEIGKEKCFIFNFYPDFLLPPASMKVKESIKELPCLIIHSKLDETVPFHHAEDLHKVSKNSKFVGLTESKHNYVSDNDSTKIEMALNEFFKKLTSKHALD